MSFFNIKNLVVKNNNNKILKGINLKINKGEIHALVGPNGHGKSTLLASIMGHPFFKVEKGSILFDNEELLSLETDKRAKKGLFLIHQNPPHIKGVNTIDFYRGIINVKRDKPIKLFEFMKSVEKNSEKLGLNSGHISRNLNEGFSGGEKKRNELLQLKLSNPKIALIDEVDSGLDADGIKHIKDSLKELKEKGSSCLIVSHYSKVFEQIKPDYVHVIVDGKIIETGNYDLLNKIENQGYKWLEKKHSIKISKKNENQKSIGVCLDKEIGNDNS